MQKDYLVSIILPTYNRAKTLGTAIQSVINQTYDNWELIIVDDGSVDDTEVIVGSYADSRIRYIKNDENKGSNYSRNRGCSLAKGRYYAFIDSDNEWRCEKLEKQVNAMRNTGDNVALCFSQELYDNGGEHIRPEENLDNKSIKKAMLERNVIDTNVALLKKEVFEKVGGFDLNIPRLQDYDLFYRIVVKENYDVVYLKEVLDTNRVQKDSITRDDKKLMLAVSRMLDKYYETASNKEREYLIGLVDILTVVKDDEAYHQLFKDISEKPLFQEYYAEKHLVLIDKYRKETRYNRLLTKMIEVVQRQKTFIDVDFFKNKRIAIYGCGVWGNIVQRELEKNNLQMEYGIDIAAEKFKEKKVVTPEQIDGSIDVIIVSNFQMFFQIKDNLKKYFKGEIVSVEELINRAYDNFV
jgi:glycosyltransferase involved in cell wall biosynthesis